MTVSNMSIEFHEWLDKCPNESVYRFIKENKVNWFRESHDPDNNESVYRFIEENN